MTHKEQILAELASLYDPDFKIPPGLYIPLGQRVLVKEVPQEEYKTNAGIIVNGAANLQNARLGIVYRIGESVTTPIMPGFKVAYDKFALSGIIHDGVQYTDLADYQIYSVVPPENYLAIQVPNTDELRRQDRIDFTKRSQEKTDKEIDKIQNDEPF